MRLMMIGIKRGRKPWEKKIDGSIKQPSGAKIFAVGCGVTGHIAGKKLYKEMIKDEQM